MHSLAGWRQPLLCSLGGLGGQAEATGKRIGKKEDPIAPESIAPRAGSVSAPRGGGRDTQEGGDRATNSEQELTADISSGSRGVGSLRHLENFPVAASLLGEAFVKCGHRENREKAGRAM